MNLIGNWMELDRKLHMKRDHIIMLNPYPISYQIHEIGYSLVKSIGSRLTLNILNYLDC